MTRARLRREIHTLRRLLYEALFRRRVYSGATPEAIVAAFHSLYYDSHLFGGTWQDTRWLGVPVKKCPLDLWVYQEILHELRPDLVIESGTAEGGSALFFASICDALDHGRVVTIDVKDAPRPQHSRIEYLRGSSIADSVVEDVRRAVEHAQTVMVTLDSDHSRDHVLQELQTYSDFVTPGSYLVVEDSNVNGHPVERAFGPGPMEAIEAFLQQNDDFEVDTRREKFYLTFNPSGFLRRKASRGAVRWDPTPNQATHLAGLQRPYACNHGADMGTQTAIEANEFFLGGPTDSFEAAGKDQLIVLLEHGLGPESTVLDIGCGCLRGGRWIIPLLDPGHYYGIEPSHRMLERGLRDFVPSEIIAFKKPRFDHNDRFDFSVFGTSFTHFLARSIWTHASRQQIETMLDAALESGTDDFVFLTSFLPAGRFQRGYAGAEWVGKSHKSSETGLVVHSYSWIKKACASRGLLTTLVDRPPLNEQRWIAIRKKLAS